MMPPFRSFLDAAEYEAHGVPSVRYGIFPGMIGKKTRKPPVSVKRVVIVIQRRREFIYRWIVIDRRLVTGTGAPGWPSIILSDESFAERS